MISSANFDFFSVFIDKSNLISLFSDLPPLFTPGWGLMTLLLSINRAFLFFGVFYTLGTNTILAKRLLLAI